MILLVLLSSDYYRIRNTKYKITRSGKLLNSKTYRIMKPSLCSEGYLLVGINSKTKSLHRLIAETFIPNPLNLPCVNHKDGNKLNNKVSNLEWCTYSSNTLHAFKNNLQKPKQGSEVYCSLLNEDIVKEIRIKYATNLYTQEQLAIMYNTDQTNVSLIVTNKSWKHV